MFPVELWFDLSRRYSVLQLWLSPENISANINLLIEMQRPNPSMCLSSTVETFLCPWISTSHPEEKPFERALMFCRAAAADHK